MSQPIDFTRLFNDLGRCSNLITTRSPLTIRRDLKRAIGRRKEARTAAMMYTVPIGRVAERKEVGKELRIGS